MTSAAVRVAASDKSAWIGVGAPFVAPMLVALTLRLHPCLVYGCGITFNTRAPDFWNITAPLTLFALLGAWQGFWAVRLIRHALAARDEQTFLLLAPTLYILALVAIYAAAQMGLPKYPYAPVAFAMAWAPAGLALIFSMAALTRVGKPLLWIIYLAFVPLVVVSIHSLRSSWICGQAINPTSIGYLPFFQAPWLMVGLGVGASMLILLAARAWLANALGWKLALKATIIALPLAIGGAWLLYDTSYPDVEFRCSPHPNHDYSSLHQLYGPFFW